MKSRVQKVIATDVNFVGQIRVFGIWITVKRFVYKETAMEWLDYKKNGNKYYY